MATRNRSAYMRAYRKKHLQRMREYNKRKQRYYRFLKKLAGEKRAVDKPID